MTSQLSVSAKIYNEPWFHGALNREKAEALLDGTPAGTYVVRDSESRPGFSLSVRCGDRTKHLMVVQRTPSGWGLKEDKQSNFPTVQELVAHYKTTPIDESQVLKNFKPSGDGEEGAAYTALEDDVVNEEVMKQVKQLGDTKKSSKFSLFKSK